MGVILCGITVCEKINIIPIICHPSEPEAKTLTEYSSVGSTLFIRARTNLATLFFVSNTNIYNNITLSFALNTM